MTRRSTSPDRGRNEDGVVLVMVALCLTALMLVAAFAIDLGYWYLQAVRLQRASDAAALAATSMLPDETAAMGVAQATYLRNGYVSGTNGIEITNSITGGKTFSTTARDGDVETFFARLLFPSVAIERKSRAMSDVSAPTLGSPFNVLGTGNLDLGPDMPKQNFWLAINANCSPKEDGDFFMARRDGNKGPFTTQLDEHNNYLAPYGVTNCNGGIPNPDFTGLGYSYHIDVPPAPVPNGTVDLMIYDPKASLFAPFNPFPDEPLALGSDFAWSDQTVVFDLFDMGADLESTADDVELIPHPEAVRHDETRTPERTWWKFATLPYDRIRNGGHFRIQVYNEGLVVPYNRGINAFSIGAFASWEPTMKACDTRKDPLCPRVYALNAMSVYNNLAGTAAGSGVDFYFAKIEPKYVGWSFDLQLWDPGEGVKAIEVIAPDGSKLPFDWSTEPGGAGFSGDNATSVQTDLLVPRPELSLSNPYKFNDRLLTLTVTIPPTYPHMVQVANSDYLRLRYIVGDAAHDRTTWGIVIDGGSAGYPHLVRSHG